MRIEKIEEPVQLLSSWKEIAAYLGRTVRTCQRLEVAMGLPVHRLDGSPKAHVFAYKSELDAWMAQKVGERAQRSRRRRLALFALTGLAVVAVATGVLISVRGPKRAPEAAAPLPAGISIAVLPFEDLSVDKRWGPLGDGIAEAIAGALQRVGGISVTGRMSALSFKGRKVDAIEIGRRLRVKHVLEATFQVVDDRLRLHADLVSAETGFRIWSSENYDRKLDDIFEIQDEIATSVAGKLRARLLAGEGQASRKRPTTDTEAYLLYLKGRGHLVQPSPESPRQALVCFEQALDRDPGFAAAYAGIAMVHANTVSLFMAAPNEAGPKAQAAVGKALALEPDLAEAHALKAWVQFLFEWDWDGAGRSFRRALELNPGDALTRGMYAMFLLSRREFQDARDEIDLALTAEPLMPMLYNYDLWISATSGRSEEALARASQALRLEPNFEFAYSGAGLAYYRLGRYAEGVKMLEKGRDLPHIPGRPESALVMGYMKIGDREAARLAYDSLLQHREGKKVLVSAVLLGWAAYALGDRERALSWLETAVKERDPHMPLVRAYAESFAPELAADPRFLEICDRIRLPR